MSSISESDKRKRRLEKNRESARECRRRKKDKVLTLHQQIAKLETDNLQLRLQLKFNPAQAFTTDPSDPSVSSSSSSAALTASSTPDLSAGLAGLEVLITGGASEGELSQAVKSLQEKHSDWGRDRRSAFAFHLSQLRRCLLPTQTTRTMLWLMRLAVQHMGPDGRDEAPPDVADSASAGEAEGRAVLESLLAALEPSADQQRQLVALSTIYHAAPAVAGFSDEIIDRLGHLVSGKNELLDSEMGNICSILSAKQIAQFILWIQANPATMQMLEALWPHLSAAPRPT